MPVQSHDDDPFSDVDLPQLAALGDPFEDYNAPPQTQAGFLRRFAANLADTLNPVNIADTAAGLIKGTYTVDMDKAKGIAETLGVRSAISKFVPATDTVFDLSAGVAQGGASLVGRGDWANEIEEVRKRSAQATDRLNAWNQAKDEESIVGPKWAARLRAADQSISESIGIGSVAGPTLASNALADYYAVKSTQDYIRDHPDAHPAWAGFHGLIEGVTTKFFMDKFRPTDAKLAGASEANVSPVFSRAVAKVKDRIGFDKSVDILASFGAEVAEEVTLYNEHYWADVLAGVEKHDWSKFGEGLKETLIQTGLTAGASEAGMKIAETMQKREATLPDIIEEELTRMDAGLTDQERELGIIPPSGEADSQVVASSIEERAADLAARKERIKNIDPKAVETPAEPTTDAAEGAEVDAEQTPAYPTPAEIEAEQIKRDPLGDELTILASLEREAAQLKQDLLDDGNVNSPNRERLMTDLEEINATIAERLSLLAEKEGGDVARQAEKAVKEVIAPRTRAQRRIDSLQSKLTKSQTKIKETKTKFKQDGIVQQQMVQDALGYLQDSLPPLERKGLASQAAKVRTDRQFEKFLDAVGKRQAAYGKKLAKKRVSESLKKAMKYSRQPGVAEKIEDVAGVVDLGSTRSRNELEALKKYMDANPSETRPSGYEDAIRRLEKIPAKDLTTDELNDLATAIDAIAGEAAVGQTLHTIFQGQRAESVAAGVVAEVEINEPNRAGIVGRLSQEAGWTAANISMRPENIMSSLSESLRQMVWENIGVESYRTYLSRKDSVVSEMSNLLNAIGLSPVRSTEETVKLKGGSPLMAWRNETRNIGGTNVTRGEALHILGMMTDPEAAARLTEFGATLGRSIGLRNVRMQPATIAINDGTLREIADFVGDQGQQIVSLAAERINTTMRDWVNDAWIKERNEPLSTRTNYFPIKLDKDFAAAKGDPQGAFKSYLDFTLESYNILKERTGAEAPLQVDDFFDVYSRHADTTARISSYLNSVSDFHRVYTRPEVKQSIVRATNETTYNGIVEAVNQQVLPVHESSIGGQIARKLTRGSGAAILGLRLTTPFMAATGVTIASQYLPNGEKIAAQALARMKNAGDMNAMEQLLAQQSPYWVERYGDLVGEATGGLAGTRGGFRPAGFDSATMGHITAVDKFASIAKGFMAEAHVRQNRGIAPTDPRYGEEVAKEWERIMYRSESSSHGIEATGGIREGRRSGFVSPFFQFESGASKDRSLLLKAGQDMRDGNYKAAVKGASVWAANRLYVAYIGAIFGALRGSDEEYKDRVQREIIGQIPSSASEILSNMVRLSQGKQVYGGPVTSLGDVAFNTANGLYDLSRAMHQYAMGDLDDEGDPKYRDAALRGLNRLVPLVEAVSGAPVSTGVDSANLMMNLFGLTSDDEAIEKDIAAIVKQATAKPDIKGPRGTIWRALEADDDVTFLQGIAEIWQTDPSKLTASTLRGIVDGRYSKLRAFEKDPSLLHSLTEPQMNFVVDRLAEKQAMMEALVSMLDRNRGQIDRITRRKP